MILDLKASMDAVQPILSFHPLDFERKAGRKVAKRRVVLNMVGEKTGFSENKIKCVIF